MSQELAANRFLMEKLNAIEKRLDSIERMLGAESKQFLSESAVPSPGMILIEDEHERTIWAPQENKMVRVILLSTLELPIAKQEPEWRPMSTAPEVHIKVKSKGTGQEYFAIRKQNGRYTCSKGALLYTVEYCSHELEGWRPL